MELLKEFLGNKELLKLPKTAFLCSRKVPASTVLECYDWAISQREAGRCIISGFHSQIEKDVFHYLFKGQQPMIIALARGLKQQVEPEFKTALNNGRLLIITPFKKKVKRVTEETAGIRNRMMLELAEEIAIGHVNPNGAIERLVKENKINHPLKKYTYL